MLGSCTPASRSSTLQAGPDSEIGVGSWSGSYTGQDQVGSTFVAIVIHEDDALAYICDGNSVAYWFPGTVATDGRLELRSAEAWTLEASLDSTGVRGRYTNDVGDVVQFTAASASGGAGLYRAEFERGEVAYIGGWVVREDGEQRGSVIGGGTRKAARNLAPGTYRATIAGVGTLPTQRITPTYVDAAVTP